ncbi:probable 2-oxoglutarate-dependent dioxygenase AOP1 [Humulus lupulus]|uniref:probable 2-oxoglutarate-dependent dioxygenase AOP1 n=1 Tax=Humulus lupulus TaxID=3486 RepID=UPI002B40D8DD|nr:probable 2-oxoglutarate-dependent dioxygenase AOP1 [Humulus lupulus]
MTSEILNSSKSCLNRIQEQNMGSETEQNNMIPVIDFSEENLKPGSDSWASASKQVVYGLEEYGCVEIVYDKFPVQLHKSIFDAAKQVFNLPEEAKMQKVSDRPDPSSYIVLNPGDDAPLYENIAIDNPTTLQGAESFTNIMWPQGNQTFRESVMSFSKRLAEMYETVMRMVFEKYGVEELFESFGNSSFHLLRLIKYKARQMGDTDVGLRGHTDSTIITILHQNEVPGLQIQTKDGHWIAVKPSTSSFVVIAGDGLKAWSNDRVRGCEHRVMILENKERYSVALFTFIKGVIHVPEEFVDDEHPLRYEPFDHFAYNRYYLSREAQNSSVRRNIKSFCGI